MLSNQRIANAALYACLLLVFFIAYLIYLPGLTGPFLFDDFPNLEPIGALGVIDHWETFWAYVSTGFSGPAGRPLSLASFLLDARDWPADPFPFKRTNLILHLLIGGVLFATIRALLRAIGHDRTAADWIALLAMALWLLNPFLVSTTLYVVQRMTQLSTLFVLLGIWGYLWGRSMLTRRPLLGHTLMTLALGLGTLLAVYSKENGALLPLLALVIELSLRWHWTQPGPDRRWMLVVMGVPTLIILYYLAQPLLHPEASFASRDFTLAERLWTEPRLIWDYLWHLFVPHIQTQGLYHDGQLVSSGWWAPWTTLPALLGIGGLVLGGWLARRRWPLVALGLLFFLAGHLLESTTIPLELYFEHRNYLPAIFLFVPIAAGIWSLRHRLSRPVLAFILLALTGSYAFATWQHASLWGDENRLMLIWAETNPASPRAQVSAAQTWLRLGRPDLALAHLEQASERLPDSALLTASRLAFEAELQRLSASALQQGLTRMLQQPFDAQMMKALEMLVESLNAQGHLPEHTHILLSALDTLRENPNERGGVADRVALRFSYYLQGTLSAGQGDGEAAERYFVQALEHYRATEPALNMVSVLASNGYYRQALNLLDKTEAVLKQETDAKLKRKRSTYEMEIARLRTMLLEDIVNAEKTAD